MIYGVDDCHDAYMIGMLSVSIGSLEQSIWDQYRTSNLRPHILFCTSLKAVKLLETGRFVHTYHKEHYGLDSGECADKEACAKHEPNCANHSHLIVSTIIVEQWMIIAVTLSYPYRDFLLPKLCGSKSNSMYSFSVNGPTLDNLIL